jgi:hypothetical protein
MSKEKWLEGEILTFKKEQRMGLIKYDNGKYCKFYTYDIENSSNLDEFIKNKKVKFILKQPATKDIATRVHLIK